MASRIMHLAMAGEICRPGSISDTNRFLVGQLLPDAVVSGNKKTLGTHFDRITSPGRKVMDFYAFYDRFEEKIHTDSLYLGYYLHLIEDCVFRKYIYYTLGLMEMRGREGFIEQLYKDYHSINGYAVKKYKLGTLPAVWPGLASEDINSIWAFEAEEFISDMRNDFLDVYTDEEVFFRASDADSVISECVRVCLCEAEAIKHGSHYISPSDYEWESKQQ